MGKVAGAALKVAAPEAAVAAKAAGKARKIHSGMSPEETNAELQRRRHEAAAKKAGAGEDQADEHDEHEDQADEDAGGGSSSGGGLASALGGMSGPATGGGFVLGLMVWAVVRAYIGVSDAHGNTIASGPAGVRMLLGAKFLNKSAPTGGGK